MIIVWLGFWCDYLVCGKDVDWGGDYLVLYWFFVFGCGDWCGEDVVDNIYVFYDMIECCEVGIVVGLVGMCVEEWDWFDCDEEVCVCGVWCELCE